MIRRRGLGALALGAALVAGACSSEAATDPGPTTPSTGRDTTAAPATTVRSAAAWTGELTADLPDAADLAGLEHGTLLRYQEAQNYRPDGATAYRILYTSESLAGEPTVVTGIATVPDAPAPDGGRPALTIAHGTTGIADVCAPSRNPAPTELSLASAGLGRDFLLAMTDYEGLGTPGRHPYLVGESEGRATMDAIRAASELPGADPGPKVAIAGYSQGGHGALWAAQVAPTWTPELELVGTFSGAPASETDLVMLAAPNMGGFGLLLIAGYHAAHPETDLATVLTPAGQELLGKVDEVCTGELFRLAAEAGGGAALFVEGATVAPPWSDLAKANVAGTVALDGPVLVIHSDADTTVPPFFTNVLHDRLCGLGQTIERRVLTTGEAHTQAAIPAYQEATAWLRARFAADGEPATSTCEG